MGFINSKERMYFSSLNIAFREWFNIVLWAFVHT